MIAGLAMAVESANVVGYQQYSLNAGQFYMIGVQFGVVGTEAGIPMKDLVKGTIPYGTQIQILNAAGTGYALYNYMQEGYDAVIDDFAEGWADNGENICYTPIPAGTCFWLKAPSAASVQIAGQVLATDKTLTATGGQFNMVANPYPVALNPNDDIAWTGVSYGDQIQVLNAAGTGYALYNYMEEGYDAVLDDFASGWADNGENIVHTGIVPVGQGCWLKPKSNVTLVFTAPL